MLPGVFQSVNIVFDPTTVSTTSNMIVTAVLGNSVVVGNSSIVVTFGGLAWTREINTSKVLPIASTMSCSGISVIYIY